MAHTLIVVKSDVEGTERVGMLMSSELTSQRNVKEVKYGQETISSAICCLQPLFCNGVNIGRVRTGCITLRCFKQVTSFPYYIGKWNSSTSRCHMLLLI